MSDKRWEPAFRVETAVSLVFAGVTIGGWILGWAENVPWLFRIPAILVTLCALLLLWDRYGAQIKALFGVVQTPDAHPAASTSTPHRKRSSLDEELAKLWLYERELGKFSAEIERANAAKAEAGPLFERAMEKSLDEREQEHLESETFGLMKALSNADAIYTGCFRRAANMSLTSPYLPSQIPIEGLEKLPTDKLKSEYRRYHDRLDSMARQEPHLRHAFLDGIKKAQEGIAVAAIQAIERDKAS